MAIKKEKEHKGYIADYWRIIQITTHVDRNETVVTLLLYKDQAAKDVNKKGNVLETKQVILPRVDGGIADIYAALKSQSITTKNDIGETLTEGGYFADAVDILEKKNERRNKNA